MMDIAALAWLALSTLISEDLASITAGLLVRDQHLPAVHAIAACVAGVYLGDLGLWWMGRLIGRESRAASWLRARLQRGRTANDLVRWNSGMDDHLGLAIMVSRFLPGARLPMYVALGVWGRRPVAFAAWSFLAVIVWTPMLVGVTVYFGDIVVDHLLRDLKAGLAGSALTALMVLAAIRLTGKAVGWIAGCYHQRFAQTMERPI
jgi:membrane protein DedA with SNARE-associated domain